MSISQEITSDDNVISGYDIQKRVEELAANIENSFTKSWYFDFMEAWHASPEKTKSIVNRLIKRGKVEDYEFEELELLLDTFGQMIYDNEIKDKTFLNDCYTDSEWAENEVKSLGYLPNDLDWIVRSNINFDGIAEGLLQNYTDIYFNGVTFHYQEY